MATGFFNAGQDLTFATVANHSLTAARLAVPPPDGEIQSGGEAYPSQVGNEQHAGNGPS